MPELGDNGKPSRLWSDRPWDFVKRDSKDGPDEGDYDEDDLVARAEEYAARCHSGQTRKDGVTPYIVHPAEMVASLKQCGIDNPCILAAAWLHDAVEDTDTTLNRIYDEFGPSVCGLVDVLTRRKPHEDHDVYNSRVLSSSHAAKLIKVADTEHNTRTIEYLDKDAQQRKLREAKELYLPLRDELCSIYDAASLFDALEKHINAFEVTEAPESLEQRTYVVIRKGWIESERGWGQKPYGYSLHLTEEDMKAFIEEHWSAWPDEAPEWYYGPDIMSSPRPFEVDEKTYQEIKKSRNGIRKQE